MSYTVKNNLALLHTFTTRHPEVCDKVDTLLGTPIDLAGKLATLADAYETEYGQKIDAETARDDSTTKLRSLRASMAHDAEHLETLYEVYGARAGKTDGFPQFVKKGDLAANVRGFIAAIGDQATNIASWDVQGIYPELQADIAEYESYVSAHTAKEDDATREKEEASTLLDDASDYVYLARDMLRRTVRLHFPTLIHELYLYTHTTATDATPVAPAV